MKKFKIFTMGCGYVIGFVAAMGIGYSLVHEDYRTAAALCIVSFFVLDSASELKKTLDQENKLAKFKGEE